MLVILPSPCPGAPTRPFIPKVLWVEERALTLYSFVVFTLDLHFSLSRSLGARQSTCKLCVCLFIWMVKGNEHHKSPIVFTILSWKIGLKIKVNWRNVIMFKKTNKSKKKSFDFLSLNKFPTTFDYIFFLTFNLKGEHVNVELWHIS